MISAITIPPSALPYFSALAYSAEISVALRIVPYTNPPGLVGSGIRCTWVLIQLIGPDCSIAPRILTHRRVDRGPGDCASVRRDMRSALRKLAGPFFIGAGALHFIKPQPYRAIMPPYVPAPDAMVAVSGVAGRDGGWSRRWSRSSRPTSTWPYSRGATNGTSPEDGWGCTPGCRSRPS